MALVNMLENVQRSATSMLPGMKGLAYEERLRKLNRTTLRSRRVRGDAIECWKIVHGEYFPDACPTLPLRRDLPGVPALRTHPLDLRTQSQRYTTDRRRTFFTQRVVPLWNSLPAGAKEAQSINSFKNQIDKAWKDQSFLYDPSVALPHGVIVGGIST